MAARTLPFCIGILSLLRELQYSVSQMSQEPLAAAQLPIFRALRAEWQEVLLEEIGILDEISDAQAAVTKADSRIDGFAGRVCRRVDDHTTGATRKQIRTALLKGKPLNRFTRAVLGGQLAAMSDWGLTLTKCGVPALAELAPEAEELVAAGRAAEELLAKAQKKNRDFRDIGRRKQFIDRVNAARKEAQGALAKLPHEHPMLPPGFADTFFYGSGEAPRDEEETIDEVKTSVEELEAQLAERRAWLKRLEDEAAAEAQAAAERRAHAQAAEELEAQAEELLRQAAALKAKVKK
ncbi:MAG: hypothetical protein IT372_28615 [Polyangiaceae bacterium]|nr:hypothetical protein [Polyangiaceae bacterium]